MPTAFLCGSFHQEEEEEDQEVEQWSLPATPKKMSKRNSFYKSKGAKNPYSGRGLDKFIALLADLDDKRRKIYTQQGAEDISLVRFVYTDTKTPKPIIVKVKDNKNNQDKVVDDISLPNSPVKVVKQAEEHKSGSNKTRLNLNFFKLPDWRRPSFYLPVFVILILFFLAFFGRSFTILCTSIGWYLVPTITGGLSSTLNSKRLAKKKKKKEISRKPSDVKVASNLEAVSSPRQKKSR